MKCAIMLTSQCAIPAVESPHCKLTLHFLTQAENPAVPIESPKDYSTPYPLNNVL